jgi:serine/threonine protein kinase
MNNFILYDELGKGTHTVVYKGRKKKTVEFFAIKSFEKTQKSLVLNEIRILQLLRHRHVVGYHNWYETKNHFWIVFEYLSGGGLSDLITKDKGLPEPMLKVLAKMLAEGLQHLHDKQVVFYNFKPSSFVFDEYHNLKFADFAMARTVNEKEEAVGSPQGYLSPELLAKKQLPSVESDLWAFGVLLHQLATGTFPFEGTTAGEVLAAQSKSNKISIQNYSTEFNDFINGMLNKNPQARFTWEDMIGHKWNMTTSLYSNSSLALEFVKGRSVDKASTATKRVSNQVSFNETSVHKQSETQRTTEANNKNTIVAKEATVGNFEKDKVNQVPDAKQQLANAKKDSVNGSSTTAHSSTQSDAKSVKTSPNGSDNDKVKPPQQPQSTQVSKALPSKPKDNPLPVKRPSNPMPPNTKNTKTGTNNPPSPLQNSKGSLAFTPMKPKESPLPSIRSMTPSTAKNVSNLVDAHSTPVKHTHSDPNRDDLDVSNKWLEDNDLITLENRMTQIARETSAFQPPDEKEPDSGSRIRTSGIARHSLKTWSNALKRSGWANALSSLRSNWKQTSKVLEAPILKITNELIEDRELTSIIMNDNIQNINLQTGGMVKPKMKASDYTDSKERMNEYIKEMIRQLAQPNADSQKSVLLLDLCGTLGEDEALIGVVAESELMESFFRHLRIAKTKGLRIALATVIGLVMRFATKVSPSICEWPQVSVLVEQFADSDETVRQRTHAAFGELLFYAATQAETVTAKGKQSVSDTLKMSCPVMLKSLRTCKDTESLAYVAKTIENILVKAPLNGSVFATDDTATVLIGVLESTKNNYLKCTCLHSLESLLLKNRSLSVLYKAKGVPSVCLSMISSNDNDLASSSASLLSTVILCADDKVYESLESLWKDSCQMIDELLSTDSMALKNQILRLALVVMSRDLTSFDSFVFGTELFDNVKNCIIHLVALTQQKGTSHCSDSDDEDADVEGQRSLLRVFCDLSKCMVEFVLSRTDYGLRRMASVLSNNVISTLRVSLAKEVEAGKVVPVEREAAESVEYFLKLLSQMLTYDFVYDLVDDPRAVTLFSLFSDIGLVLENCSDDTGDSVISLISMFYRSEERLQRFLQILSTTVFDQLCLSFPKERSEESKTVKFRIISDMYLMVFVENSQLIPQPLIIKSSSFIAAHLNCPIPKVNALALKTFRVCLEKSLVTKSDCNFMQITTDLFESLKSSNSATLNQNFFMCVGLVLKLSPECLPLALKEGFVQIGSGYLDKYSESNFLDEVVESLDWCFQLAADKPSKTSDQRISLSGGVLQQLMKLVVRLVKTDKQDVLHSVVSLAHSCLVLGLNLNQNSRVVVTKEFNLNEIDFAPILKAKDRLTNGNLEMVVKIAKILKGMPN